MNNTTPETVNWTEIEKQFQAEEMYCVRYANDVKCECGLRLFGASSLHRIIVWDNAKDLSDWTGRNPANIKGKGSYMAHYTPDLGPFIRYKDWAAEGFPAHDKGSK